MHHRAHDPTGRGLGRLTLTVVAVTILVLAALGVVAVGTGRYQIRPILSGSMRPGLPVGGVVIAKRVPISALEIRDVVVFHPPNEPNTFVVHRIISLEREAGEVRIQTQGDANDVPDAWTAVLRGRFAYRAVYTVPLVGYIAVWAHNPDGRRILLLAGLLLLAVAGATAALQLRRRRTSPDPPVDQGESEPEEASRVEATY